ncbi:lamin tail domain-containing protein [Candidatus Nomurabacteria bacterium]|nr:lamin tail domain-containing protein [Candidatus Nomurabacteria bacterium]
MNCKTYSTNFFFGLLLGVTFPFTAVRAAVSMTEIAWMGIAGEGGQYGEWIELYNDSDEAISLAGWTIRADDDVIFTLTKTIIPHAYLLVERVTPSMPDPLPAFSDEAGSFGSGGLSNEGENLSLRNSSGDTVQMLSYVSSGWPAGSASTKETMQWRSGGWITAEATPGTAALAGGSSSGGSSSGGSSSSSSSKPAPITYEPRLTVAIPSELYQYVEYEFIGDLLLEDGKHHTKGPFRWNFGDGTSTTQEKLTPVVHAYQYPGTYTLWVGYYETVFNEKPLLEFSKTIKVGTPSLSVSRVDGTAVEITNLSGKVVDLSGWKLFSGGVGAVLPDHTLVAPDASIIISAKTLGFSSLPDISLTRPTGERVITTSGKIAPSSVTTSRTTTVVSTTPLPTVATQASAVPVADFFTDSISEQNEKNPTTSHRTRSILFFGILALTAVLYVLLERVMIRREG